jgi:hypothetical protein
MTLLGYTEETMEGQRDPLGCVAGRKYGVSTFRFRYKATRH